MLNLEDLILAISLYSSYEYLENCNWNFRLWIYKVIHMVLINIDNQTEFMERKYNYLEFFKLGPNKRWLFLWQNNLLSKSHFIQTPSMFSNMNYTPLEECHRTFSASCTYIYSVLLWLELTCPPLKYGLPRYL